MNFYRCATVTALVGTTVTNLAVADKKPNVVVIISDDLHSTGLSYTGGKVKTPNIDSIFNDGVFFSQSYVTWSTCAPSRAGIMTGRAQARFGYEVNTGPNEDAEAGAYGVSTDEIFLGQLMKDNGYHTSAVGKWHLGVNDQYLPNSRGFDHWLGFKLKQYYFQKDIPSGPTHQLFRNNKPITFDGYNTEFCAKEVCSIIKENAKKEQPFFIYYSPKNVHAPVVVPENYIPEGGSEYDGMVAALDVTVGTVLNQLKASNVDDNTLVIFINDNGGTKINGLKQINPPYRGKKSGMFEGGLRVAFGMKWPGKIKPGTRYDKVVSSLDIVPTVVAAVGGTLPTDREYDGVDLLPYINGTNNGKPHDTIIWRGNKGHAIRMGNYKLVWQSQSDTGGKGGLLNFKVRKAGGYNKPMLFDLSKDIGEKNDIAKQKPEVVQQMIKLIDAYDVKMAESQAKTTIPYGMSTGSKAKAGKRAEIGKKGAFKKKKMKK